MSERGLIIGCVAAMILAVVLVCVAVNAADDTPSSTATTFKCEPTHPMCHP